MDQPAIVHTEHRRRYEIMLGSAVIGRSYYRDTAGRRVFTHTEVEPDYQGQGLATRLVEWALADTRASGLRIVALCPTVAAYLRKHHEYDDILDPADSTPP